MVFFTFISIPVHASELATSADILEGGHWSLTMYGRGAHMEPVVEGTNTQAFEIPVSGGTNTIFSHGQTKTELEQEWESIMAAIQYRPYDGLTYRLKAGTVQDFSLQYSSGAHVNEWVGTQPGMIWGVGLSWNVSMGTMVSPAIALDASFSQLRVKMDRFQSPGVSVATSDRFEQDEIQVALNVSKRFKKWEPFGGLKINRVTTRIVDDATKDRIKGIHDGVAPFFGLQWEIFPREMVVVEGSLIDDQSVSAGLKINF